jgi:hypothetical protein
VRRKIQLRRKLFPHFIYKHVTGDIPIYPQAEQNKPGHLHGHENKDVVFEGMSISHVFLTAPFTRAGFFTFFLHKR